MLVRKSKLSGTNVRRNESILSIDDLHWLHLEGSFAVLGKRPDQGIQANIGLRSVQSSHLNQNILCVDGNFGMFSVDDGRNRADHSLTIQNERVDRTISDQMQVFFQFMIL